jgi:hypothetical protein
LVIEISFGQTASHSPSFEQLPNPSASCRSTIDTTRVPRSTSPCGSWARWLTFADVNSTADAFLHAATHAPQPMHAAESIACSTVSLEIRMLFASWAPPTLTDV